MARRITAAGRQAFKTWINREPGAEQIRFPLLVTLRFGRHLDPGTLSGFLESNRAHHEQRLRLYESITPSDAHIRAALAFGIACENAVIGWLESLGDCDQIGLDPRRSPPYR